MSGFLLHLSGPLQSYGSASVFNLRDTLSHPTRSAVIGMLAAAFGHPRGLELTEFELVELTVRVDREGHLLRDFHTIGGGRRPQETPLTANGGRRPSGEGTIITERDYLADAAFTVAVDHPDPEWAQRALGALRAPHWAPYLGRRSCPTDALFVPTGVLDDPVAALERFPLHRPHPNNDSPTVPVTFVTETPPLDSEEVHSTELNDNPRVFWPEKPGHHSRTVWYHTKHMPADLCAGYGNNYLNTVASTTLEASSA